MKLYLYKKVNNFIAVRREPKEGNGYDIAYFRDVREALDRYPEAMPVKSLKATIDRGFRTRSDVLELVR